MQDTVLTSQFQLAIPQRVSIVPDGYAVDEHGAGIRKNDLPLHLRLLRSVTLSAMMCAANVPVYQVTALLCRLELDVPVKRQ